MEIVIEDGTLGIRESTGFAPAKGVITHHRPDIDSVVSTKWLFNYFGISHGGDVQFKSAGEGGLVEKTTPEDWLRRRYVLVDVGGNGENEKSGKLVHLDHSHFPENHLLCAATIVYNLIPQELVERDTAKELLSGLVDFVRVSDLEGSKGRFDLGNITKSLRTHLPDETVFSCTTKLLDAYMENRGKPNTELFIEIFEEFSEGKENLPKILLEYLDEVKGERTDDVPDLVRSTRSETRDVVLLALGQILETQSDFKEGRTVVKKTPANARPTDFEKARFTYGEVSKTILKKGVMMMSAKTDNTQFPTAARYLNATIAVVENSKGQIQILTDKRKIGGEIFWDIASAIRVEETRVRKDDITRYNSGDLYQDGISKIAPNWYVFSVGGMILNGSETNPGQEPTKLTLSDVVKIIGKVVNEYMPLCKRKHPCDRVKFENRTKK